MMNDRAVTISPRTSSAQESEGIAAAFLNSPRIAGPGALVGAAKSCSAAPTIYERTLPSDERSLPLLDFDSCGATGMIPSSDFQVVCPSQDDGQKDIGPL